MAILAAIALGVMLLVWKELKLLAFDPDFGVSLGFPIRALDVLLTSLLVVAIVIGLQTVGVVLMAAMLIAAAAARRWTDRLGLGAALAALFGALGGARLRPLVRDRAAADGADDRPLRDRHRPRSRSPRRPRRGLLWRELRRGATGGGSASPPCSPTCTSSSSSIRASSTATPRRCSRSCPAARCPRCSSWSAAGRCGPRGGRVGAHGRGPEGGRGVTSGQIEIQLIAVVVAVACALPGTFLVLRRLSLVGDAISHSILLGICPRFFVVGSVNSPLLLVGAAAVGLATVVLVQLLERRGSSRRTRRSGLSSRRSSRSA